jgi:hypothetical protein
MILCHAIACDVNRTRSRLATFIVMLIPHAFFENPLSPSYYHFCFTCFYTDRGGRLKQPFTCRRRGPQAVAAVVSSSTTPLLQHRRRHDAASFTTVTIIRRCMDVLKQKWSPRDVSAAGSTTPRPREPSEMVLKTMEALQ